MRLDSVDTVGVLHFIGIGGIGMSGIAEVLHSMGYTVQGSDMAQSPNVERLQAKDIAVHIGHNAPNIYADGLRPAAVIISSAVPNDNAELIEARAQKVPVVRRADMLAELMRFKSSIAIGGTHGKTTTTSLVGTLLEECGIDPTVINGGIVNSYGTNTRMGQGEWMVVEADESDGSFTRLPAQVAVVTNIDPEHMEHYGAFDNMRKAFSRFIENIPFYGFAVLCLDHPEVQSLIAATTDRRILTYGFNPQADIRADNIRAKAEGSYCSVTFAGWLTDQEEDTVLENVFLPMPGRHNLQNALAALSIGYELGLTPENMRQALASFAGVKRRFTKTGEVNGISIIDDYGHHPVEITAVLKAARQVVQENQGRIIAVMQPHRYSRLNDLFDAFCKCFHDADMVFVADIHAAGEQPIDGIDKEHFAEGLIAHGHRGVHILDHEDDLAAMVYEHAQPNDLVVCLGAGSITKWANALPAELETLHKKSGKNVA
jgi:UDP-N-acetylmuramate--alanine ligase